LLTTNVNKANADGLKYNIMEAMIPESVLHAIPMLVDFPQQRFWVDYDREADVLYISFRRPQNADDSVMTDEGILLRYREDVLIGVTVLDASERGGRTPQ
jgi:uncharacterized protein YuzE